MENEKRLIDANALGIGKAKREVFDNPAYADGWNSAIAIIDNAPTVDAVEVVHGRWIVDAVEVDHPFLEFESVWRDVHQCSICKEYFDVSDARNYCPNCGAKMDGDGE